MIIQYLDIRMPIVINSLVAIVGTILVLYLTGSFHVIDEGHIGVYKRGGALLSSWTEPGLQLMVPFITSYYQVQVTLQSDQVKNIPVRFA